MHSTYHGWKAAIRKKYPDAKFEGNKDICQAFNGRVGVGEWDGAVGEVFCPDFTIIKINPDTVPDLPVLLSRMGVVDVYA